MPVLAEDRFDVGLVFNGVVFLKRLIPAHQLVQLTGLQLIINSLPITFPINCILFKITENKVTSSNDLLCPNQQPDIQQTVILAKKPADFLQIKLEPDLCLFFFSLKMCSVYYQSCCIIITTTQWINYQINLQILLAPIDQIV